MTIAESDWKKFKELRAVALERLSQKVLDECEAICRKGSTTPHEKYLELYKMVQERDDQMAKAFDIFSRSTAILSLRLMVVQGLVNNEELSRFSEEVQRIVGA
jgi:hypothetical protein